MLQTTISLESASWTTVTEIPVETTTENTLTLPATEARASGNSSDRNNGGMKTAPMITALVCAGGMAAWLAVTRPSPPPARVLLESPEGAVDVAGIIHEVENFHGSKFDRPPAIQRVSPELIREKIRSALARDFPPALARARERTALLLGLTRQPFDWLDSLTGLIQETASCHYDAATHTFFLPEILAPGDQERIVSTVARALISPSLPGLGIVPFDPENDDIALAAHVVLQARVSQIQTRYSLAHPHSPVPVPASTTPGFYGAPPWLRARLQFSSGMVPAFSEVLKETLPALPRNSAEIMHPGHYQRLPLPPLESITFPNLPAGGPARVFENVMGEFGVLQIHKAYLTQERANTAAAGWKADRYLVFTGPDESAAALLWQTRWTTESDAVEFLSTAHDWLLARFSLPHNPTFEQPGGGLLVETPTAAFPHRPWTVNLFRAPSAQHRSRSVPPAGFNAYSLKLEPSKNKEDPSRLEPDLLIARMSF